MDFPIDFVVTWVDGSDKEWVEKKRKYDLNSNVDDGDNRYRDYGLLENWFQRVWKYAPWVRRVYLITDGQAPAWACRDKRISIVNHTDFIPTKYLPVFNSNAIEMNLWRIADLSEHFVYFNDDMYLTQTVKITDFFSKTGLPVLNGSLRPVMPRDDFSKSIFKNMVLVNKLFPKNKYFSQHKSKYLAVKKYGIVDTLFSLTLIPYSTWVGFFEDHLFYPNLKSWFKNLNRDMPQVFDSVSRHRFRQDNDYTIWLLKNMYIASGNFEPRDHNIGNMYKLTQEKDLDGIRKALRNDKVVIIEDDIKGENSEVTLTKLKQIMEKI